MKIQSIEPTPSPNSMKLNMDESLPEGKSITYTKENKEEGPDYIQKMLEVQGIKNIYHVADFMAIERNARFDWKQILPQVREVLGEVTPGAASGTMASMHESNDAGQDQETTEEAYGEVHTYYQMFRGIPMQVKLTTSAEEKRVGLPERFMKSAMRAESSSANLVMERKWEEQGVRYGDLEEIGEQIVEEISAAYDDERLNRLVALAFEQEAGQPIAEEATSSVGMMIKLDDPDWKKRYAALERMQLTKEEIPVLAKALKDSKQSIRRLATAYLGEIGEAEVLPYLFEALQDKSPVVRRTAGDCLSDMADPRAIDPMIEALRDPNKLVRWRAARFLYEVGEESAVPALRQAQDDPEFEVSLQVKIALERIEGGEAAEGSVWQQMTRGLGNSDKQ